MLAHSRYALRPGFQNKTKEVFLGMKNVLSYLEMTAGRFPDKIAVVDETGSCTYRELLENSRRVGSALAERIGERAPVAVFMEKGIHALYAFFGAVWAGGFYSLLSPALPAGRLVQIRSVLAPAAILVDSATSARARELFPGTPLFLVEELQRTPAQDSLLFPIRQRMVDTDPLYVQFTSGSTGIPKGVVVSHRSVVDFIDCFTSLFGIGPEDRIGNQAPFDFDVSVKDIYSAVKTGATLVIIPRRLFSQPPALLDFLCSHWITTMIWAVSALSLVSAFHGLDYKTPHSVNKILFSGEVMPLKHLRAWREHLPDALFVNLYGPTEVTCNCTYHILDRSRDYKDGIPLGKPFPNEHVFLLDEEGREIGEPGVTGEICVRGTALALGYYRAPEETARHFVQNPLNSCFPETIYRTGDLGVYRASGELFFCGRKDFQIKYMGHRIELEEVEKAIQEAAGVEQCCCVFDQKRLWAFYSGGPEEDQLRRLLQPRLPAFMLPGKLQKLDRLPLTPNGKTDRKALLAQTRR